MTNLKSNAGIPQSRVPLADMNLIPAGPFTIGASGWGDSEAPVHQVVLQSYWIDKNPVTNAAFQVFVNETGYLTSAERKGSAWGFQNDKATQINGLNWRTYAGIGRENHPVILVSWFDAKAYAEWAGKRLPTEAEFEKAARGGLDDKMYPWGNESPDSLRCNMARRFTDAPPTTPIQSFPPNGYGLYDMCGNVWNWCEDWFAEDYYAQYSAHKNPAHPHLGPESGATKVRRGGSWNVIQAFRLRCSNRGAYLPADCSINIGFRCAKDSIETPNI
jgi:formylglycine-generating enzyme